MGQYFIESICRELHIEYEFPINKTGSKANQSPWDIRIDSITFELKTATEDVNGEFQFNHIRYHREYEAIMCLGVSPMSLLFNIWSKADIVTGSAGKLASVEKSANASYKLTKTRNELFDISQSPKILNMFCENYKSQNKSK